MKRCRRVSLLSIASLTMLATVFPLTACGEDNETTDEDRARQAELEPTVAGTAVYEDWEAVELRNGLVEVAVVPALGGRIMGYTFNDRNLLYVNPEHRGQLPGEPARNHEAWVPSLAEDGVTPAEPQLAPDATDPGGEAVDQPPVVTEPGLPVDGAAGEDALVLDEPAAEADAAADAAADTDVVPAMSDVEEIEATLPEALPGGEPLRFVPSPRSEGYVNYGGQVTWPAPQNHWRSAWPPPALLDLSAYVNESPGAGEDRVEAVLTSPEDADLGLQLLKTVTLHRAATAMRVVSELRNIGRQTRLWALQDVSQHAGALAPGESFTKDVQVYLPLNEASRYNLGFAALLGPQTSEQYQPEAGVLRVEYLGEEGLIGTDSHAGWAAYVDKRNGLVLAKVAVHSGEGLYPDDNITATAYTAPADEESYVQLTLRSPLTSLAPGESTRLTVHYGIATCPAPIVGATAAGVVSTPLKAEAMPDTVQLSGLFGSFYAGYAQVAFHNAAGEELARTEPMEVSPARPYALDTVAPLPDGAVTARLVILNHRRSDVATLSEVSIVPVDPTAVQPAVDSGEGARRGDAPVPGVTTQLTAPGAPGEAGTTSTTETPLQPEPPIGPEPLPMPAVGEVDGTPPATEPLVPVGP